MKPTGRILQGDSVAVLRTLEPESVHAVVTDPPYGLHFMGKEWDQFGGPVGTRWGKFGTATGQRHNKSRQRSVSMHAGEYDTRGNAEYGRWMQQVGRELHRVLKPGGHLLMFGAPRRHHWQGVALELAGFEVRDTVCWLFGQGFPKSHNLDGAWEGWGTALKPGWEPIIVARKPFRGTVAANVREHGTGALNVAGCNLRRLERARETWNTA